MQVAILKNPNGLPRGKFHRHDSYDCPGRRQREETYADGEDYELVDLRELEAWQKACQFPCCFQGLPDAEAVAERYPPTGTRRATPPGLDVTPRSPGGVRVGHKVAVRDLDSRKESTYLLCEPSMGTRAAVDPPRDAAPISSASPVGAALLGHNIGETVTVVLPNGGTRRLEIIEVS